MNRWLIRTLLALAALAASSCARNAILELELELPASPEPLYVVVDARSDRDFDAPWGDAALEAIPLPASCARAEPPPACGERTLDPTCSLVVSIVGGGADEARPLRVRVRFCTDPACALDPQPPEHRVELERAFYLGRYTQARVCIDAVPTSSAPETERIERCEVRCRDGSAAQHCRLDGTHFCEAPR